ncbi:MAG: hypothetical protein AAGF88_07375 [Pseudomonadota bacterium]
MDKVGVDAIETHLLTIARHVFQSFSNPASQGWLTALQRAQLAFGNQGPDIFARLLDVLQSIRCARTSCFMFNAPTCAHCAQIATEHERRMLVAIASIRRDNVGRARAELMMLCEGASTQAVLAAIERLIAVLPAPERHVSAASFAQ